MCFQLSGNRALAIERLQTWFLSSWLWLEGVLLWAEDRETCKNEEAFVYRGLKGAFLCGRQPFPTLPDVLICWELGCRKPRPCSLTVVGDPGLVEPWIFTFSLAGQVTETELLDFTFVYIPGYLTGVINVCSNTWRNRGHSSILLGVKACLSTGQNQFWNCWFATCVWDLPCEWY